MENAIVTALSRQRVLANALDVAANNIANQNTVGFRGEHIRFQEYVSSIATSDSGDAAVSLVYDAETYTDFSLGSLEATDAPLDFAIADQGFFAIETGNGVRYTRDGHFSINEFGELVDRNGDYVLDRTGTAILIDFRLGPIAVTEQGEIQQNQQTVGQLGVFVPSDLEMLRKSGFNQFQSSETALSPITARIRQGFVETSNVSAVRQMTDMVQIIRAYEGAAQILETANELSREAVRSLTLDA